MERILNITCNWRHCTLEYLIKTSDSSQDMSRQALLKRYLKAAEGIDDWNPAHTCLMDLKKEKDAPEFTNFQAKYDEQTSEVLSDVRSKMERSLKQAGIITKVLQNQYMVQLLMVNYLEFLKKQKVTLKADRMVDEKIDLPEMSAIFTEMILTDRECEELKKIRKILVNWRNA